MDVETWLSAVVVWAVAFDAEIGWHCVFLVFRARVARGCRALEGCRSACFIAVSARCGRIGSGLALARGVGAACVAACWGFRCGSLDGRVAGWRR